MFVSGDVVTKTQLRKTVRTSVMAKAGVFRNLKLAWAV